MGGWPWAAWEYHLPASLSPHLQHRDRAGRLGKWAPPLQGKAGASPGSTSGHRQSSLENGAHPSSVPGPRQAPAQLILTQAIRMPRAHSLAPAPSLPLACPAQSHTRTAPTRAMGAAASTTVLGRGTQKEENGIHALTSQQVSLTQGHDSHPQRRPQTSRAPLATPPHSPLHHRPTGSTSTLPHALLSPPPQLTRLCIPATQKPSSFHSCPARTSLEPHERASGPFLHHRNQPNHTGVETEAQEDEQLP